MTDEQVSRQVSLPAAAAALGISVQAVRRRIKSGELRAEQVKRPQGYAYRVTLPADVDVPEGADTDQALGADHLPAPNGAVPNGHARHLPGRATPPAGDGIAVELLADLRSAHARIEVLERERFELAGRLGYFQSELEHARQTIKALEAPKEPIAPAPPAGAIFAPLPADPEPPHRPWWRFW